MTRLLEREGMRGLDRLPCIGPTLARRLHDELDAETLEQPEVADWSQVRQSVDAFMALTGRPHAGTQGS